MSMSDGHSKISFIYLFCPEIVGNRLNPKPYLWYHSRVGNSLNLIQVRCCGFKLASKGSLLHATKKSSVLLLAFFFFWVCPWPPSSIMPRWMMPRHKKNYLKKTRLKSFKFNLEKFQQFGGQIWIFIYFSFFWAHLLRIILCKNIGHRIGTYYNPRQHNTYIDKGLYISNFIKINFLYKF